MNMGFNRKYLYYWPISIFVLIVVLGISAFIAKCICQQSSENGTRLFEVRLTDSRHVAKKYGVQVVPLVALESGTVISPNVRVKRTRKGFMDRIEPVIKQQEPLLCAIDGTEIALPADINVNKCILLVKSLDEETGWRIFEMSRKELVAHPGSILVIPDLLTLPSLNQQKDHANWWNVYERAEKEYKKGVD